MQIDLSAAWKIAVEVHGNQRDKAGEPYLFHIARVAMQMETDEERAVAILHDAIEEIGTGDWLDLMTTIVGWYGPRVERAVMTLTHDPAVLYMDYIRRVAVNPLAVKVKLADLLDNSAPERLAKLEPEEAARLSRKYDEAYRLLMKDERCGKPAMALIPRLGMYKACALTFGHDGECQPGGRCFRHGEYIGDGCPQWPDCINGAIPVESPDPQSLAKS